jgi:molybdopterin biosynthesis enzyme
MYSVIYDFAVHPKSVHWQGVDIEKGAIVLTSGEILGAPEIGLLATVGVTTVKVESVLKLSMVYF